MYVLSRMTSNPRSERPSSGNYYKTNLLSIAFIIYNHIWKQRAKGTCSARMKVTAKTDKWYQNAGKEKLKEMAKLHRNRIPLCRDNLQHHS